MAKILCITTGLTGILHASYKVVSLLENAGHEVIYACPWDVKNKVEKQNFKYVQLDEINFNPVAKVTEYAGKFNKLLNAEKRRKKAANLIETGKFENLLDEFNPDVVLIDMELHDLIITSVSKVIPTILLSQWFSVWKNPNLPPLDSTLVPNNHLFEIKKAWLKADIYQFLKVARNRFFTAFTDRASILREFALSKGFPIIELSERMSFPPPITYKTLPVISLTDWELEFPHTPRKNLFYVGSMVSENRIDEQSNVKIKEQLDHILEDKKKQNFKLIYCSLSTMNKGDEVFLKRLIKAISNNKEWKMVIALGGVSDNNFDEDLPKNVYIFEWIPQLEVLKHADCSINHGGIHTINECIHFNVPMLIYSGKQFDQNGCAARVSFHRLGIMADKDSDNTEDIESKIKHILEDSSYSDKIAEINIARSKNENKLIQVIDKILDSNEKEFLKS